MQAFVGNLLKDACKRSDQAAWTCVRSLASRVANCIWELGWVQVFTVHSYKYNAHLSPLAGYSFCSISSNCNSHPIKHCKGQLWTWMRIGLITQALRKRWMQGLDGMWNDYSVNSLLQGGKTIHSLNKALAARQLLPALCKYSVKPTVSHRATEIQ